MKSLLAIVALALAASSARAEPKKLADPKKDTAQEKNDTAQDKKDTAQEEMAPADVTRWLSFFDKLVDAVVANEGSCDKMANQVSVVIDANRGSIAIARDARDKGKKLPLAAQHHMLDGVKKMSPGIENCADNARVKAAFAKLEQDGT
jgi:hypothetical protein